MTDKILHLRIEGIVQGVYYRQSTIDKAKEIKGLSGWVRNRSDASVEVLVSGATDKVDDLFSWCRQGPSAAEVTAVQDLGFDETDKATLPAIINGVFRKEATF